VTYSGPVTGRSYSRTFTPSGAIFAGGAGQVEGPLSNKTISTLCESGDDVDDATDEPGWEVVWWIDAEGDHEHCFEDPFGDGCAAPEPSDPQARTTFTFRATGITRVDLVATDP